jgi:hypothetical protein
MNRETAVRAVRVLQVAEKPAAFSTGGAVRVPSAAGGRRPRGRSVPPIGMAIGALLPHAANSG